jgi:hypothetical protein
LLTAKILLKIVYLFLGNLMNGIDVKNGAECLLSHRISAIAITEHKVAAFFIRTQAHKLHIDTEMSFLQVI